ncbi:MAG: hypothetical protein ABI583_11510 [Betaproteobacteria bacterium]
MKITISVPDPVFHAAEKLAANLKTTRSQLYSEALASFVNSHASHNITERLNAVYAIEGSTLAPEFAAAQSKSLVREAW